METIFISSPKHKALQIWKGSKCLAKFEPRADFGVFITDDPKIIKAIKETPEFNKIVKIWEGKGQPQFERKNIHHGVISTVDDVPEEVMEQLKKQNANKFIRFGELKAKLLKKDGSYRGDASEEEIAEYEQLKKEIEG